MRAGDRDGAAIVEALRHAFADPMRGLAAAYVFGSVARNEMGARSDVDVAVLFDEAPPPTLEGQHLDLAERLEAAVERPVDLVVLNSAPADLVHRILRDGILLTQPNPVARIRFEVRSRNEYFDLAPIRERYRRPASGRTDTT